MFARQKVSTQYPGSIQPLEGLLIYQAEERNVSLVLH